MKTHENILVFEMFSKEKWKKKNHNCGPTQKSVKSTLSRCNKWNIFQNFCKMSNHWTLPLSARWSSFVTSGVDAWATKSTNKNKWVFIYRDMILLIFVFQIKTTNGLSLPDLADVIPTGEATEIDANHTIIFYVLFTQIACSYLCYIFGKFNRTFLAYLPFRLTFIFTRRDWWPNLRYHKK